jgi:hypothetical protein
MNRVTHTAYRFDEGDYPNPERDEDEDEEMTEMMPLHMLSNRDRRGESRKFCTERKRARGAERRWE